jgi:glycosyltransferase involved in cell wall biosynthesis
MSWATPVSLTDRVRQTRRLLGSEGSGGVSRRLRRRVAERLVPAGSQPLPVNPADLDRAERVALGGWAYPAPPIACPDAPMSIAWVCAPPGPGSGGHTTMFRLVAGLERAGHRCTVYLHDRHGWSTEQHVATIRTHWPEVGADVRDLADGIADCDAVVATSWPTAYAVVASPAAGRRVYLVQDFEPLFSAAGSEYLLAESTYRFGFHGLTAGRWLAEKLSSEYGMASDYFDFACDPGTYKIDAGPEAAAARDGVVYYCRPETPRRAHELALMALERFARQHPATPIHTYGSILPSLPFEAIQHGVLSPPELAALYNRCIAGLSLSATNVSLVPLEMLAAGCVPVVNDAHHNRVVLDNGEVSYADATPWDLARALSELVDQPAEARERRARAAAGSVRELSWTTVQDRVARIFERIVREARIGAG